MPFIISAAYNQSSKQYETVLGVVAEEEISAATSRRNSVVFDDWYRLIGLVVANKAFKDRPALQAAVLKHAFAKTNADRCVDTSSFSSPVITL